MYQSTEDKLHTLFPDYVFSIHNESHSINYADGEKLLIEVFTIAKYPKILRTVEIVARNEKEAIRLITHYMSTIANPISPLPFDELPSYTESDWRKQRANDNLRRNSIFYKGDI